MGSRRHARLAKVSVREITEPDQAVLEQLFQIEMSAHQDPWPIDAIAACFQSRDRCFGLYLNEELVGFSVINVIVDEAELYTIGVMRKYQGLGFGRQLLLKTLQACVSAGAARCFLEVRVSNEVALHLYDSYGFTITGTRKNYYGATATSPAEDAYTMACDLSEIPLSDEPEQTPVPEQEPV